MTRSEELATRFYLILMQHIITEYIETNTSPADEGISDTSNKARVTSIKKDKLKLSLSVLLPCCLTCTSTKSFEKRFKKHKKTWEAAFQLEQRSFLV